MLVLFSLALGSWIFYKLFLRRLSSDRHRNLRQHFRNLANHFGLSLLFFGTYEVLDLLAPTSVWQTKLQIYIGFFTIIWSCIVLVKTLRIIAFEYLFLTSKKVGVPLLLVNILTLLVSLVLGAWVLTSIFRIELTPILATSAVFSVVLGLALQDTLGNLFAAVALQFDKPFDIGDWIEVKSGTDKISGQVQEISWRSTVLLAITDEIITVPNRHMAQSQISNFAGRGRPFVRSHVFRVPHDADIDQAKELLLRALDRIEGVARWPAPVVIITETTDSWVSLKVVYNIIDYGAQFGIADRYLTSAIKELQKSGVRMATPRLTLENKSS